MTCAMCRQQPSHTIRSADRSGISLEACGDHLEPAREAVAAMATAGVEIIATKL